MQRFNTAYSTYFNLRHHRVGHLYQGRFKALLVEADEYLRELSRYIHLNPVRLKKYKKIPLEEKSTILREYRWSSLSGYLRLKDRVEFMNYDIVLGYKGGDTKKGRRRYRQYVLAGLKGKIDDPKADARANAVLGSDSFVVWVKEKFLSEDSFSTKSHSHLKAIRKPVSIRKIADAVAEDYGLEAKEIIRKRSRYREARQVLMEISHRLNLRRMSMKKMGMELGGISGEQVSQVHKIMQVKLAKDKKLVRRVERIIARL